MSLEYWTDFRTYLEEQKGPLKSRTPQPRQAIAFAVGRSGFHLNTYIHYKEQYIGVQIVMTGSAAKPHFHLLNHNKEAIEAEIGTELTWNENPNAQYSSIYLTQYQVNPADKQNWPEQHTWLCEKLIKFYNCFSPRVKLLNADDYLFTPGE